MLLRATVVGASRGQQNARPVGVPLLSDTVQLARCSWAVRVLQKKLAKRSAFCPFRSVAAPQNGDGPRRGRSVRNVEACLGGY